MKPDKNYDYLNPKMVTIIITRKCTIACPMCFFGCSPEREEVISRELALKAIEEINQLRVDTLGITGGEPFLEFDLMKELVEKAASYGMIPIVVTNAHWATTEEVALNKLNELKRAGLSWIQISLDEQHQKFIPRERVANIVKAAKKLNFENIKIIGTSMRNSENFKYYLFSLQEISGIDLKDIDILDRPRVSHKRYEDHDQIRYDFSEFLDSKLHLRPMPDCLNEMMVDVNGDLYPCCNNFVGSIGNLSTNTFQDILETAKCNKYVSVIGEGGPAELALFLDANLNTDFCKRHYSTWCELCSRIFERQIFRDLFINPHTHKCIDS